MPSELQRVAQALVAALDEAPRVVDYLLRAAQKYRENAGYVGHMSNNPAAQVAAMHLDEAARRCEEAAHYLAQAPPKARGWAEQMASGIRTTGSGSTRGDQRPDMGGGSTPSAEGLQEKDGSDPEAKKAGKASGAGDEASPKGELVPPRRIGDEEGWRLQGKLPVRDETSLTRQKTRGIWKDADGNEHSLASGQRLADGEGDDPYYQRVVDYMRDHRIGRHDADPMVASHVEAKFALFMRERGLLHETIVVNKLPCPGRYGCDTLLNRFVPPGGTLTVFGPGGFKETYPKPE